jgi:putative membrane protein
MPHVVLEPASYLLKATPMGDDSQFRDHAANERTLLAWIRTGIALMAFGFAIARFGLFLREMTPAGPVLTRDEHVIGSGWFGVVLVVLGLVTNLAAMIRYVRIREALQERRSIAPGATLAYALGIGSALVALAMAVMLARTLGQ